MGAMGGMAGPAGFALQGLSMVFGGVSQASEARARARQEYSIAEADARSLDYQAEKSSRAAEIGRIQADQIDTDYRDDLNTTIANIRAVRAASGASPQSPTSRAIEEGEAVASDRIRRIRVGSARMQATQDDADARFYREAAKATLLRAKANVVSAGSGMAMGGLVRSLPYFVQAAGKV